MLPASFITGYLQITREVMSYSAFFVVLAKMLRNMGLGLPLYFNLFLQTKMFGDRSSHSNPEEESGLSREINSINWSLVLPH